MFDKFWSKKGGRIKEWIRSIILTAINHGYLSAIASEPGHFYRQIVHVISWLPTLWDDRDFDNAYLYIMMREKLHRMRMHHERDRVISDWKEVADQIKVAEKCLDRLIRDEYVTKDFAEHQKKFGSFLSKRKPIQQEDGSVMYKSTHSTACGADVRRIGKKEEELKKEDLRTFAKMFVEHSREWWS